LRARPNNEELWLALLTALILTGGYALVLYWTRQIPAAGSLFGHTLGIIGFVLMLMAETLYSFRKRSRRARWGSMESSLKFHIYAGLVGPYMVLLHSSWKFHGLAGVVTLLTLLIVPVAYYWMEEFIKHLPDRLPEYYENTLTFGVRAWQTTLSFGGKAWHTTGSFSGKAKSFVQKKIKRKSPS
jgi:hypothetical protein